MDRRLGDRKVGIERRKPVWLRAASPFVGRAEELSCLTAALTFTAEGQGSTIFLTGESGVGKTRLAREALALAAERGFTTLEGYAHPLKAELAYGPFLDAFRPLLRSLDPARLDNLVSELPSLGRLFEGLGLPSPEPLGDPALERTRLFEAMLRLLERLAQKAPVALFIDDVHWADSATIELLHYLARGLSDQRALLLATYNCEAFETSSKLRGMVPSLQQDGLAEELVLSRLGSEAVDKLVRGVLNGEAPAGLLSLLQARACGTPLFIEALVTSLVDSGNLVHSPSEKEGWVLDAERPITLPPSIRHLILDRLGRLAPNERLVLDLISVLGDGTWHTILRAASGLDEQSLLHGIRSLRAAGLLTEGMDGSEVAYGMTHPLIQEVARAELPEMERQRIHLAAVEVLESLAAGRRKDPSAGSEQILNWLAYHYHHVGAKAKGDRAVVALISAGERALAVYANAEAVRHFEAALAMAREGKGTDVYTLDLKRPILALLLERLGEARERIGERGAALSAWNEALNERELVGDAVAAARLRRQLALAEWDRGHFDIADAHLRAGFALLQEGMVLPGKDDFGQELFDLHFARFRILYRLGDLAGMTATARELMSLAPTLASPRAEAEASFAACGSFLWQDDPATARAHALRALMLAQSVSEGQELELWAHVWLVIIGMRLGDHHLMRYHCERGLPAAQRLGVPSLEVSLRIRMAYASFLSGGWDESLRWSKEAIGLARRVGYPRDLACALAIRAVILALRGDVSEAELCVSEAKVSFGGPAKEGLVDGCISSLVDIAEIALALERGQVHRALNIAKGFVRSSLRMEDGGWSVGGPRPSTQCLAPTRRTPLNMPVGLMLLAEAQVAAEDLKVALETARQLIALGPADTPYLAALANRAEGLARRAMGQQEAAIECLARAHETFTALGMPFEAARALLEQTEAAALRSENRDQGIGDGGPAPDPAPKGHPLTPTQSPAQAAQQSLATFERLGAQRYAERARRLLRGFGISPAATNRLRLGGGTVSERELEIARLVAAGLTTAQIAKRLALSPLSVGSHLHRIYTRLDIRSRASLARLVIEAGLLSREDNIA